MTILKLASLATVAAVTIVSAPAMARPNPHAHDKQICKIEHVHGHAKRVCHWVHR